MVSIWRLWAVLLAVWCGSALSAPPEGYSLLGTLDIPLNGFSDPLGQVWPGQVAYWFEQTADCDGQTVPINGGLRPPGDGLDGPFEIDCEFLGYAPGPASNWVTTVWGAPIGGGGAASSAALTYQDASFMSWAVVSAWVSAAALLWLGRIARG